MTNKILKYIHLPESHSLSLIMSKINILFIISNKIILHSKTFWLSCPFSELTEFWRGIPHLVKFSYNRLMNLEPEMSKFIFALLLLVISVLIICILSLHFFQSYHTFLAHPKLCPFFNFVFFYKQIDCFYHHHHHNSKKYSETNQESLYWAWTRQPNKKSPKSRQESETP